MQAKPGVWGRRRIPWANVAGTFGYSYAKEKYFNGESIHTLLLVIRKAEINLKTDPDLFFPDETFYLNVRTKGKSEDTRWSFLGRVGLTSKSFTFFLNSPFRGLSPTLTLTYFHSAAFRLKGGSQEKSYLPLKSTLGFSGILSQSTLGFSFQPRNTVCDLSVSHNHSFAI